MTKTKPMMLSSAILRDKVRKVKNAGDVRKLAEKAECTAAFLYWWLESEDRDMRLELAVRVYKAAINILKGYEDKQGENHD